MFCPKRNELVRGSICTNGAGGEADDACGNDEPSTFMRLISVSRSFGYCHNLPSPLQ